MDNVIKQAKADLERLRAQAAELEGKIQKLELFVSTYDELAEGLPAPKPETPKESAGKLLAALEGKSKRFKVEEFARRLLLDGNPRTTQEIYDALKSQGFDPASVGMVSVILSTAKGSFVSDRKTGWTLKKS